MPVLTAQEAFEPREQDGEIERLWKVVVGARFESLENVFRAASRGEHQQRDVVFRFAQFARNGKAVFSRQHYIENERFELGILFEQQIKRLFAFAADVHGVAFGFEIEAQTFGEMRFVFADEDPGRARLPRGSVSVKVLPWPSPPLSAKASPPYRRATERTMKRPSPVPLTWPVAGFCTR